MLFLVFLILLAPEPMQFTPPASFSVEIDIVHPPTSNAEVAVALYASSTDWLENAVFFTSIPATNSKTTALFKKVPPGTYGAAVFLDKNKNGKLDRTLLGFFKEPMGFSREARIRFGPPKWSDAAFEVSDSDVSVEISLN